MKKTDLFFEVLNPNFFDLKKFILPKNETIPPHVASTWSPARL
jgi:hypothetical protein